ncbi:hypothetical protein KIV56_13205 [Cryobacterium breve]|uniref:TPM domain-containing protein n=1 Tax=Cryobacterium breve TaxID=1259258 RepID=A0ABY7NC63_9MICO|nr:hypothetical protein [Cryobacterium breve]WBM79357.1 hypothetical protein KIV56_13205 [Cryobacterium breve]
MTGDLWWVPSAILLAFVVLGVTLVVASARRRRRDREQAEAAVVAERARAAAIALVRADDQVGAATDELGFAVAQFGEAATRDFATALELSRRQLRDAFALQQKLDDSVPDTESERRRWTEQIIALAAESTTRLAEQDRVFTARRGRERDAPLLLEQLTRRVDRVTDRVASGAASIDRLRLSYAPTALAAFSGNVAEARTALGQAKQATDAAAAHLKAVPGYPIGDELAAAELGLFHAGKLLDAIETGEDQLHVGQATLNAALDSADAEIAEARTLRDGHEESVAAAELNRVITAADAIVAELRHPSRVSDPAADLARLREVLDGLDVTRSEARNQQLRLDNARAALAGALLAARSQGTVTRSFIAAHPGRVGAEARTRLAESERLVALAEAEADPVTALDTARRATTLATDADALARYDARFD